MTRFWYRNGWLDLGSADEPGTHDFASDVWRRVLRLVGKPFVVDDEARSPDSRRLLAWTVFIDGWLAVPFRCQAMVTAARDYEGDFASSGLYERSMFRLDSTIFSFFTSAHSALECLVFGMHGASALRAPWGFRVDPKSLRNVNLPSFASAMKQHFPTAPITFNLNSLARSEYLDLLRLFRNSVAHRATVTSAEGDIDATGEHIHALIPGGHVGFAFGEDTPALRARPEELEIRAKAILHWVDVLMETFEGFLQTAPA